MTHGDQSGDIWVCFLNQNGEVEIEKTYGGPLADNGKCIQELSTDSFILSGEYQSIITGASNAVLLCLNSDGKKSGKKL